MTRNQSKRKFDGRGTHLESETHFAPSSRIPNLLCLLASGLALTATNVYADTAIAYWGVGGFTPGLTGLNNVASIAAGNDFLVQLKGDGTIACWGVNSSGQCNVPPGLAGVINIAAGYTHAVAIQNNFQVVCWGSNANGECTVPPPASSAIAASAGDRFTIVVRATQMDVVGWGLGASGQINPPPGLLGVTKIAAGASHALALKVDGTIAGWGSNQFNASTPPLSLTQPASAHVIDLAAGLLHSVALKSDGSVVCWGMNDAGQCNAPPTLTGVTGIAAAQQHTAAVRGDGTVVGWGIDIEGQTSVPVAVANATRITADANSTYALHCAPPTTSLSSGNLGPVGYGVPCTHTFANLPRATTPVKVTVNAIADLGMDAKTLVINFNGGADKTMFVGIGSSCPAALETDSFFMSAKAFNALTVANGGITVRIEGSVAVNGALCPSGSCDVALSYGVDAVDCDANGLEDSCEILVTPSLDCDGNALIDSCQLSGYWSDCNGNGTPDVCDIALGYPDSDADGRIDTCEIALGDFNLDGFVNAGDLAFLLSNWGPANGSVADLNGDGSVDAAELSIVLNNWGIVN